MLRLIEKITSEFDLESYIEVYVLDKSGDPFEIYGGLCENINNSVFEKILTSPGCLYAFIIIAKSSNTGSIDSKNDDLIIRKEFCWLTDPLPPVVQTSKKNSISLQWQPVQFCGVDVKLAEDSLQYILEGAEGHEWKGGMASKFVTENTFMEYRLMCRGPTLLQTVIEDLKPANWYHFRVAIEYMGVRVTSESKSICTLCSIPSPPAKPRVQVVQGTKSMQNKLGLTETKVKILWVAPVCNGSSIEKYHTQLQEVLLINSGVYQDKAGSILTSSTTSPTIDKPQNDENFLIKSWQTVYCNLLNEVTLSAPLPWRLEWRIRVRAKNTNGWSAFSPTLTITTNSHPSLFQTAFVFQKSNSINHSSSILSSLNLPNISHHPPTIKPMPNSYYNTAIENNPQNPSTDIPTPQSTRRENETSLVSSNKSNPQKLFTSTNKVQNRNYNNQDNENQDSKYKEIDHKNRLPFQASKSNEFDFLDEDYYQDDDNANTETYAGKRNQSVVGDSKTRTSMLIKSNNSSTSSSSNKIDIKSDKVNRTPLPAPSKKSSVTIQEDNNKFTNHPLLSALSSSLSNTYPVKTGQKLRPKSESIRPSTTPASPASRPATPSVINLADIPIEMNDANNSFQKAFIMSEVDRVGFGTPISTTFIKNLLEPILTHIAVQTENGTLTKS